ncbi:hypothetical protein, partial [Ferrimonas kyonanensis]|uniref:hypothetical protein n=1 Tax=Ferrimonas kyonanensis TaxID=364763 RepID=UPI001B7F7C27
QRVGCQVRTTLWRYLEKVKQTPDIRPQTDLIKVLQLQGRPYTSLILTVTQQKPLGPSRSQGRRCDQEDFAVNLGFRDCDRVGPIVTSAG